MGLDQFAYRVPKVSDASKEVDTEFLEDNNLVDTKPVEITYWRKHPNLQGMMEQIWNDQGNEGEFNCVEVYLEMEDLEKLEEKIKNGSLPETQGFFFGGNSDDHYKEKDLEFIKRAKEALEAGDRVFYTSWW